MFRVGLTGGIAAGKSVVSGRLAERGGVVIDYDVLAREAVHPGSLGLLQIAETFGAGVVRADGTLDRTALATIVFGDDDARARLDAIVHPEIRRMAAEHEAGAVAADPRAVVVHDVPLLVETGRTDDFHLVVVVDAPESLRLERLVEGRGLSVADARSRIAAQADDDDRREAADVVLDGTGTRDGLEEQVDALWERLVREAADEAGDLR
ncbi:dephospho-CoA kinase [Paraoerskovia sediminicola]|uniref:Dephospho-CoA kinase n=1 Tax=Paraoerskovia sediminicola TaxID=1138587 RepID=A0ABM8G5Z6_9CELL|nr:dephospho-CoA kinase [Paraoerskovia sediminicola]BDZ43553.1 dephospho-CoA kinase [Paraoerskovia sediminicola]